MSTFNRPFVVIVLLLGSLPSVAWAASRPSVRDQVAFDEFVTTETTYQVEHRRVDGAYEQKMPTALTPTLTAQVDVYDGPSGKGFVVTAFSRTPGQAWYCATGQGPEARNRAWREWPDDP